MSKEMGILFSAKPNNAQLSVEHLDNNAELYWTTTFPIKSSSYSFPVIGLMHINGDKVRYKCRIIDIRTFKPSDYSDPAKKPYLWRNEYHKNPTARSTTLVITKMPKFDYRTKDLIKIDGTLVKQHPQRHVRVYIP